MNFSGRQPSVEDNLWWKTSFGGRHPLVEDDLWWKTTFLEYLTQAKSDMSRVKCKKWHVKSNSSRMTCWEWHVRECYIKRAMSIGKVFSYDQFWVVMTISYEFMTSYLKFVSETNSFIPTNLCKKIVIFCDFSMSCIFLRISLPGIWLWLIMRRGLRYIDCC